MLLRCRDLWDRCYVTCCDAADVVGWGGGWDVNVPCASYITCCYAVEISVGVQKFLQSRVESKDSRLHIQFCVEMQCGQGCEIERTWHVGKDLQVKNTKTSFFSMYGDKK